jgi:hypothetical protein
MGLHSVIAPFIRVTIGLIMTDLLGFQQVKTLLWVTFCGKTIPQTTFFQTFFADK